MVNNIFQQSSLYKQTVLNKTLFVVIILFFLTLGYFLSSLLTPLVLAIFFSYALSPLISFLERKKVPSFLSVAIVLIGILSLLTLIVYFLYLNINSFLDNKVDEYIEQFQSLYQSVKEWLIEIGIISGGQDLGINYLTDLMVEGKEYLFSVFKSTSSFLSNFLLFVLYLLFLLPGMKNIEVKVNRAFDYQSANKINAINSKILVQIQQYISRKGFVSLLTAIFVYLFCVLFGIDLALVWGILTFLLNFIPNFGSIMASVFPILMAIIQLESLTYTILFISLIVAVQFSIGNIIEPKIFARGLSLSALVVIISLIFFSFYWGVAGVFLSVPLMVVISIICRNIPSLRPIGIFLQGTYPIKEDIEKLSLYYHLVYKDQELSEDKKDIRKEAILRELYTASSINKEWKKIKKHPLSLDTIFTNLNPEEKVQLYHLAIRIATLDNQISDHEIKVIKDIQKKAQLTDDAVKTIHQANQLDSKNNNFHILEEDLQHNNADTDEQLAYSYGLLGKKYLDHNEIANAKKYFYKAIHIFIQNDNKKEINNFLPLLNTMELKTQIQEVQ